MKKLIFPILMLALASLACGLNVSLPEPVEKTGETVVENFFIPRMNGEADVAVNIGGGELSITSGAQTGLLEGEITYNVADFKPVVTQEGTDIRIDQGTLEIDGIPTFENVTNEWDLSFSADPVTLRIGAGAYRGTYDFGGMALSNLYIEDGASDVKLTFSQRNLTEMTFFDYQTGASSVELNNLANANFSTMTFRSGVGNYTLDFSGVLNRDASVKIESGLSNVKVIIPEGTKARVVVDSGLTNVTANGDWTESGNTYSQEGGDAELYVVIELGAGNLELTNR
jgi:hypothetical protein